MKKDKHLQKHALVRMIIFGSLAVVFIILSFVGLIANSQGAKDRYESLIAVDQAGGDVEEALNELRTFIYSHMNTQVGSELGVRPPIQLRGTYERLVAAEQERVARVNESLYAEAQADCERRQPEGFSGRNRLDCIEAYVDANGQEPRQIDSTFYKFDFTPPVWSPDLAGFSILLSILFGCVFLVDVILYFRTKNMIDLGR